MAEKIPATALYKYTEQVYEYMNEHAQLNEQEELLYKGSILKVFDAVGASRAYYSPIRTLLISPADDPCISYHQRGNASQPSIIRLLHPPPKEWENISQKDLTGPREAATLGAELEDRIDRLEAWRESLGGMNIARVLQNFEKRLAKLEREGRRDGKTA